MDSNEYIEDDNLESEEHYDENEIEDVSTEDEYVTSDDVIRNAIDDILGDRGQDALDQINMLMADRVTDALADKKQEIASTLGQGYEEV